MTRTTKRCPYCKAIKTVENFHKNRARYDGLANYCRDCAKKSVRPVKTKIPKSPESLAPIEPEPKPDKHDRYSIIRNTSRRTGASSWGIWDSVPYGGTNSVCYVADNLKDALLECGRLNAPPETLRYTKHGQTGFIDEDEEIKETF